MTDHIDEAFLRVLEASAKLKEYNSMPSQLNLKILIRTDKGDQQEFTLSGLVKNPDIQLGAIAFELEQAINNNTRVRAHAEIVAPSPFAEFKHDS